eukprot:GFUD01002620.1.p1 GENE.GFUD01002620.1~~GFUD01002620.1.p1  ORF type:complete len:733 (-),score=176.61 GFUD01002620.1:283-2481(-)
MDPDQCWTLSRVPNILEGPEYLLQHDKEFVTFGRRQGTNDKICNGPNVSRNHLKFVRQGSALDWRNVNWSILDLGGTVGTFVNMVRIEPSQPFSLKCGDLIGVGCPEHRSTIRGGDKETFVYRIKSPRAWGTGNILRSLALRELGLVRNNRAKDFSMLKDLVTQSSNRVFQKMVGGPIVSQGEIKYGDGKVIIRNSATKTMDCYNIRNNTNNMVKLWSLPARPRWEDYQIDCGPLPPPYQPPLPLEAHKARLTVLRSSNRLQRYNMDTGNLKQDLILSRKHRFTELAPDPERGLLVLSSVRVTKTSNKTCPGSFTNCNSADVLKSFIIFENIPLQFLYHFEISKLVFGSSIQDAAVCLGLLLVMYQNKNIEIFSMEDIIKYGETKFEELHDCSSNAEEENIGFPINLKIVEKPPCLFVVKSDHHHLEMNMNPWLYIKSISDKQFSVHELNNDKLVTGGVMGNRSVDGVDHENVMFSPDDSSRVIHFGSFGLRVMNIERDYKNECYHLREMFSIKSDHKDSDKSSSDPANSAPTTRVGRHVRRPANYYDNVAETVTNVTFQYEDELNLFAVLVSSESINDDDSQANSLMTHIKEVKIYDKNFSLLRTESLDVISIRSGMDLSSNVSLTLDQDLLLVSVKSSVRTTLHAYKLRSKVEVEESSTTSEEPVKSVRKRRRSNRPRHDPRTLRRRSTWNERYDLASTTDTDEEEEDTNEEEERSVQGNTNRHRTRSGY